MASKFIFNYRTLEERQDRKASISQSNMLAGVRYEWPCLLTCSFGIWYAYHARAHSKFQYKREKNGGATYFGKAGTLLSAVPPWPIHSTLWGVMPQGWTRQRLAANEEELLNVSCCLSNGTMRCVAVGQSGDMERVNTEPLLKPRLKQLLTYNYKVENYTC